MRALSIFVGILMLAGSVHVNVMASGGYSTSHGLIMPLIATGVAVGALRFGSVWVQGRWALATFLVAGIVAAEAWSLYATAERLVISRESVQGGAKHNAELRANAKERLEKAEAALKSFPSSSPQLEAAMKARQAASEAITQNSAKGGCRENCRLMLQATAASADADVARAKDALDASRRNAEQQLKEAQEAMRLAPLPMSTNPLAERLGAPAWLLDLMNSALGSIALNGLACCLLASGAHGRPNLRGEPQEMKVIKMSPASHVPLPFTQSLGHPARFASECLRPASEHAVSLEAVEMAYRKWCETNGLAPVQTAELATRLALLFKKASVSVAQIDGKASARGVELLAP